MMASFSFGYEDDYSLELYAHLFSDVNSYTIDYSYEILEAALEGRIDLSKEFHINSFVKKIKENKTFTDSRNNKRKVVIIDSDEEFEDAKVGSSCIFSSALADNKDDYQKLLDSKELDYLLGAGFDKLFTKVLTEYNCNLIVVLRNALNGVKDSIEALNHICESDAELSEAITAILSSGISFDTLLEKYNLG